MTTALASAKWTAPWAALLPSRAASRTRIPPSTWSILCCCWANCCWELQLSPSSHSVSPTLTTTPARGIHHFTLVRKQKEFQCIKNRIYTCIWKKMIILICHDCVYLDSLKNAWLIYWVVNSSMTTTVLCAPAVIHRSTQPSSNMLLHI